MKTNIYLPKENDYILSANIYKPGITGGGEDRRDPKKILKEIGDLDLEIDKQKIKIKALL